MADHFSKQRSSDDEQAGPGAVSSTAKVDHEQSTGLEDTTLNPGIPRPWHAPMTAVSFRLWRQILGLNPFKGSYFGLYKSLQSPGDRLTVIFGVLLAIAAGVPLPIIGVIFGEIISSFPPDQDELRTRITQLLGVAVAYFVVTSAYTTFFSRTGERIAIHLRERLLRRLLYAEQAYLDVQGLDYNGLLRDSIDTIQVGCSEKVGIFLQSMSYFVAAFTVGFILNAKLTGVLFAAVIPSMILVVALGSTWISKFTKLANNQTEKANATALSALRAIQVVQAYGMIEQVSKSHRGHLDESSRVGLKKAIASALELGGAYFIAYSANGLAFYMGSKMAAAGEEGGSSGTIYAVVFLILDASFVVGQFAPFLEIFARAASAYGKIQEIMEAIQPVRNQIWSCEQRQSHNIRGNELRFESVSFCYPTRPSVSVLDGLDLVVYPGSFNAIVGTSGGGKSTVVALLMRLYDYSGKVFCGDWELRDFDKWHLRRQIAVLDQECILFHGSIYDNICYGLMGSPIPKSEYPARCDAAIIAAGIDFLAGLADGVHTKIDNTQQLSGGQRQRVCLARALISRPALLVLDEPTSALDARSELKVMSAVQQAIANGTTVLMIAHRLSTVLGVDHVTVLQDGRAVEHGPPTELVANDGVFAGLLAAQNTNIEAKTPDLCFEEELSQSSAEETLTEKQQTQPQALPAGGDGVAPGLRMVFTRFIRLTRSDHLVIVAGICASIISGAMIIGESIVFGGIVQLLNVDIDGPHFQRQANFYCLMFFVLSCIALLAFVGSGTAFGIASSRLVARVQGMLLNNTLQLDIQWFAKEGHSANELSSTFAKDASDLACLSGVALGTVFTVIVSVFGGIILAHAVAWKIAVVLLSAVPVMLASGFVRLRLLAKSERRHRTAYTDATNLAIETCQGRKTVTILGLEEFNLKRYHDALRKPYKAGLSYTVLCNTLLALSLAITYFVYALAYWWGSKQVRNGSYSQRQFFTVLPALLFSAQSAGQLFSLSPEIARAKTAAVSVFRLLSYTPTILAQPDSQKKKYLETNLDSSVDSLEKPPKIEFERVDFSYSPSSALRVLENVSFSIQDGETIALVGPSGAGKSSIIALFERFFDPQHGAIRFDGEDLKAHDVQKLRRRMALLSQVPELFPGSIRYNIALGIPERTVDQQEIERVAALCGMHDFISSLPEGYATECGSVANSQLSGGQRQRIALARALLREPEVLLLDEPTSALDAQSERQVQAALQAAEKGRTTILVAHRLASVQHADKIIVLDGGHVVEQGTHAELVELGGLYASMARAQAIA